MKADNKTIKELLKKLSVELLGRPMSKQDEARFDTKWKAATKKR